MELTDNQIFMLRAHRVDERNSTFETISREEFDKLHSTGGDKTFSCDGIDFLCVLEWDLEQETFCGYPAQIITTATD